VVTALLSAEGRMKPEGTAVVALLSGSGGVPLLCLLLRAADVLEEMRSEEPWPRRIAEMRSEDPWPCRIPGAGLWECDKDLSDDVR